jgi:hypothetical protein
MFMRSQLERAINLSAKTGDKIIVIDEFNDRSSVVMNLDDYERLLRGQNKRNKIVANLTEEELLDKINHDIVSWKNANSDEKFSSEIPGFDDEWENEDDDELDFDDENDSLFALQGKASEDKEINTDIFPDFTAPNLDVSAEALAKVDFEGNIIPEEEADDEIIVMDEPAAVAPVEPKADEDENLYYYNEPEKTENEKEESGFTSIKDELKKNKKAWSIPEEAKEKAEEVPF